MQISFVEPLSRAWERMRRMLFSPFELGRWLVLGFSAWLAGLASGDLGAKLAGNASDRVGDHEVLPYELERLTDAITNHPVWMALALVGVVVAVAILIALLWVSSRGKLVFLDNVVHERAVIVEPWQRLGRLGDSLFWWRLGFAVIVLALVLAVLAAVVLPAAAATLGETLRGLSIAAILLGALALAVVAVVALFIVVLLEGFVIPIMHRFDLSATAAWRTLLPWFKRFPGWFIAYVVVICLAAIALQMMVLILCLFTCCIVLIPYVGTVILLPVWVLYRAYSVEFLAQFHPDFDLFEAAAVVPPPVEPNEPQ
ncbi:MAG: hypothetical protein C3F15_07285 [Holophagae bacterium]|nr:MAG: hypothetical protein C3F15_07285 [Holophagae bacterium]